MVVKNCGLNYGIRIRKKNSPKQIQDEGFKVDLNNSRYKFIFARNQRVVMFTSKQKLHQTMADGGGCVEFQPMVAKYAQVKLVFIFRIIRVKSKKWKGLKCGYEFSINSW